MTAATVEAPQSVFWRPSAALRVGHQLRLARRLTAAVLAAICAFTLLLTAAPHASSNIALGAETRVAAQTHPAAAVVGAERPASPAFVGGNGVFGYDSTTGCCAAPSGAVDDVVGTANRFSIHDRVAGQLNDPRLGNLQGRFGTDDLQALTTSPNATAYLDVRSGHINVIQEIDGVLLRITTAADEFRIISVGRVRPAQLTNGSVILIGPGG